MKALITDINPKRICTFNSGWGDPDEGINFDGLKICLNDEALAALATCVFALMSDRDAKWREDEHERHLACERAEPEEVA